MFFVVFNHKVQCIRLWMDIRKEYSILDFFGVCVCVKSIVCEL